MGKLAGMRGAVLLGAALLGMALLSGPLAAAPAAAAALPPPANGKFDYQIGGAYRPASDVVTVERDAGDVAALGRYNICYLNGFQTQPGSLGWWKAHHRGLLLRSHGRLVIDSAWNEVLLNTRTRAKRRALAVIMNGWVRGCRARGYDAIELDNLDSFSRSRHLLRVGQNLALARLVTAKAHELGLAVAQKNAVELGSRGKNVVGFDFAIAEECQRFHECSGYLRVYGANVVEIEYTDYTRQVFAAACAARGAQISIIRRDRNVVPAGQRGYSYESC